MIAYLSFKWFARLDTNICTMIYIKSVPNNTYTYIYIYVNWPDKIDKLLILH